MKTLSGLSKGRAFLICIKSQGEGEIPPKLVLFLDGSRRNIPFSQKTEPISAVFTLSTLPA